MKRMKVDHEFEANGVGYRMDVFHLSDQPLVFRYQFQRRDGDAWENVAYDDREYDDPSGLGVRDERIVPLLKTEAPLMAREFLEYMQKKATKKSRKKK
ncbi:MAG TPA: hypothetical protein VM008_17205 [Phycisphaerae bacterium]|nr:hypothetical protein [Phycisphaerae bacterium]